MLTCYKCGKKANLIYNGSTMCKKCYEELTFYIKKQTEKVDKLLESIPF